MTIRAKYEKELKIVFDKIVEMCREIEWMIDNSMLALVKNDHILADQVIDADKIINNYEREIESACLKILLMEHPFASDFREVSAGLKMITDLERIGDQARDVAELSKHCGGGELVQKMDILQKMAKSAIYMVKEGVNAFINHNLEKARGLDKLDDVLDKQFCEIKDDLIEILKENGEYADQCVDLMMIAKYYERIGDHAVNLGEWVEFAITGNHQAD